MHKIVRLTPLFSTLCCSLNAVALTQTELAGNSLGGYPHFDYVKAFHADAPVEVAIDPTRFPAIAGITADVYVVAARSWALGDPLIDAGAGPDTYTFSSTDISSNILQVAAGGELDADAGVDVGVPYDVVIDVDRDGTLSSGDFLDGDTGEAGLYVLSDTTLEGPLSVSCRDYNVSGVTPGFTLERTCFPTLLISPDFDGRYPLVVVSHGNGHNYQWYDYLQRHIASYGYIVMSHQNNTGPGITTASTTTLEHTDALLGQQGSILGGVLDGHIDSTRMTWIGHSRGGEGIVTAYTRISLGDYLPSNYDLDDIALMSSIAPTDFADIFDTFIADPEDTPYHLIYGSADGDVSGAAELTCCMPFRILERAAGYRQSTYVHGADHNDFNCCGFDDFTGPAGTAIGRAEAQQVYKGIVLPLIKHYIEGNVPARDFFWRQYESFRPLGVAPTTTVVNEYKQAPESGKFVIDDFQTNPAQFLSSSGGFVLVRVDGTDPYTEDRLDDNNTSLTWVSSDPFNGMTRALGTDDTRGAVFSVSPDRNQDFMLWLMPEGSRDVSGYQYLSFRAAQGTRHPLTIARLGNESWQVLMRDGAGVVSTIDFDVYGGGIQEPYQRTGSGSGVGWANEFETIRIRLTDFATGTGIDLSDIRLVGFVFRDQSGHISARLGFDDLELTVE